ncbi:MAG TPA: GNAT family N-acetyltransferase [Solirubrobacteraceae bacterium]|nr:GNAT family N-acetyltransferase [Solirubrobacteraceae bacterium]
MPWKFTREVEPYAERVLPLLRTNPEHHTVGLSVIETLRAGHRFSDQPMLFGWLEEDGEVRGAISHSRPSDVLLLVVPYAAELATALRAEGIEVPGVNGDVETVDRFCAAWTVGTALEAKTWMRMRQFALGELVPPDPPPPGRARPAAPDDFDLAMRWFDAFSEELGLPDRMQESWTRQQIEAGMLWLWEDEARTPVALALRTAAAEGVARIICVYTPPEHRGRRYGGAVTAACSADALAREAERVVLFTDLDNPAPNAVYQRIGYRPLRDYRVVHFQTLNPPQGV